MAFLHLILHLTKFPRPTYIKAIVDATLIGSRLTKRGNILDPFKSPGN